MDPSTAWALALRAGFEMVTEIVKGQPDAVKMAAWERWNDHMEWLHKRFFKDEKPPP